MKHFFTISLCFLALSLSAQEPDGICCDPDGTNYTFINCLQSGCCGLYDNDGCVEDPDCSNYNPSAGCLSYCEGQFDECGICNGPGAIYDCGCSEMPEGDCDCFGNELDACGECGGDNACLGCMISLACNYDPAATVNDGSCEFLSCLNFGCNDPLACNYDANADYNDGTCVYASAPYDCNGDCVEDTDGDGVCDVYETYGCTDTTACNYNDTVTEDDGNCTYAVDPFDCFGLCVNDTDGDGVCDELEVSGCTDVEACNYDYSSTDSDNSICEYAEPNYDCDGNCLNDSDGDGICDELEVLGCSDVDACNYSPEATDDDGSCDYTCCPGPGCCSIGHYWDWELDQCFDINPTDSNLDGCTDLNDLMDLLGAYGDCAVAGFTTCGDDIEHEGYSYSTVQIGDQCWFSENCRYLPVVSPSSEGSETEPYYYVYDYQGTDLVEAQATANYETYGVLYNWPAAITEGLCPSGWHIPSDDEWQALEIALGMSEAEATSLGFRGSPVGDFMKSTSGWNDYNGSSGNGSNSSGFNVLPAGNTDVSGNTVNMYQDGSFWSSTLQNEQDILGRNVNYTDDYVYRFVVLTSEELIKFSARCIKD
jgi:uncharacterized protein (TIGR02145 family)